MTTGPLWALPGPAERRPRHTRERIAAAALAIADTEGIDAVTMRRVATELGAGTMTLYHYVRSKADLLALMHDAIMGEQLVPPGELPGEWRAALTTVARRARATFRRHPWAVTGAAGGGSGAGGPGALEHFEQSLAAVAGTGLPAAERIELIALVDDYVSGFVLKSDLEPGLEAIPADAVPAIAAYFEEQLATGRYPHTAAVAGPDADRWARLAEILASSTADARFERGLALLLDGVEARIARATTA